MTALSLKKSESGIDHVAQLVATGNPDAIEVTFWAKRCKARSTYRNLVKDSTAVWTLAVLDQAIASDGWEARPDEIAAFRRQVAGGKKHDPFDGVA